MVDPPGGKEGGRRHAHAREVQLSVSKDDVVGEGDLS